MVESSTTNQLVEHFFRRESANLIAVLTRAFGFRRENRGFKLVRIDATGARIDVDENRARAGEFDGGDRRNRGMRNREDQIVRPEIEGAQGDNQSVRSACHVDNPNAAANSVSNAATLAPLMYQPPDRTLSQACDNSVLYAS